MFLAHNVDVVFMDQHLEQTLGHQLVEEMANQPSKTHQVHYISLSGLHRDELNKATMIVRGEQRKVWDYIIGKPATKKDILMWIAFYNQLQVQESISPQHADGMY